MPYLAYPQASWTPISIETGVFSISERESKESSYKVRRLVWFGLDGISTIVGYLMLNLVYTYILDI